MFFRYVSSEGPVEAVGELEAKGRLVVVGMPQQQLQQRHHLGTPQVPGVEKVDDDGVTGWYIAVLGRIYCPM